MKKLIFVTLAVLAFIFGSFTASIYKQAITEKAEEIFADYQNIYNDILENLQNDISKYLQNNH